MERLELKQNTGFEKRIFKINDNSIEWNTRKLSANTNMCVDFDRFILLTREFTESTPIFFKIGWVVTIIGILQFLAFNKTMLPIAGIILVVGILFFVLYKATMKVNLLYEFDNDSQVFIYRNNPNKKEFQEFIETLNAKLKNYYRDKYFHIDQNEDPVYNINRMRWLKERGVISNDEFETVLNEINQKRNPVIGFHA